jgi:hypothetical protein
MPDSKRCTDGFPVPVDSLTRMGALMPLLEIEFADPVVGGIGIVIRDTLAAQIVERALNDPGNTRDTGLVERINKGLAPVIGRNLGEGLGCRQTPRDRTAIRSARRPLRAQRAHPSPASLLAGITSCPVSARATKHCSAISTGTTLQPMLHRSPEAKSSAAPSGNPRGSSRQSALRAKR